MLPILGPMATPDPVLPEGRATRTAPEARPAGRPRDTRLDEAILTATQELLEEAGYPGLTMEAVARRAGTTKPAIRRRWPSRQHLVIAALADTMGTAPTPDTGCTHCDLIEGIDTLSRAFGGSLGRRTLPALMADLADDPALDRVFTETIFHPRRATTEAALRRGVERGDIRPDADIDLLLDMLGAPTYHRVLFGHLPVTDTLAHDVVMTVMGGAATPSWREHYQSHHEVTRDFSQPRARAGR
ncbi:TetR family transcriptional regulator [Streptomyces venezuelae]|uniref:TetR family transcriptional regulator n=2 Tax=Streptomyces venezuelae TaxID=54571 RepID=A0A5P2C630_STRVZ|nr:TetR family transcriptional regulator [Streptomyces venezuelae]